MSKFIVTQGNTFEEWRVNTNQIASSVGDTDKLSLFAIRKYTDVSSEYDFGRFYPLHDLQHNGAGATFSVTIYSNPNYDPIDTTGTTANVTVGLETFQPALFPNNQKFYYTCTQVEPGNNQYLLNDVLVIKGSNLGGIDGENDLRIHVTAVSTGYITEFDIYGDFSAHTPSNAELVNDFIALGADLVPDVVSELNQIRVDLSIDNPAGTVSSITLDTTAQTIGGSINELFQIQRGAAAHSLLFSGVAYPKVTGDKSGYISLTDAIEKMDDYQGNGELLSLTGSSVDQNITKILLEHGSTIGAGESDFTSTIPILINNAGTAGPIGSGNPPAPTDHPMGYVNLSDNITDALISTKSKVDFSLNEHGAPLSKIQAGTWVSGAAVGTPQNYDHGYANYHERIGASDRWNIPGAVPAYLSNTGISITRVPTENDFLTGLVTQEVYETAKLRYFRDPAWGGIGIINKTRTARTDGSPETGINTLITILNTLYESSKGETLDNVYLRRDGMFDMFDQKSSDAIAKPLTLSRLTGISRDTTENLTADSNMLFFRTPSAAEISSGASSNPVEQMRIDWNGNVGIGKAAEASAKLDVNGNIKGTKLFYDSEDTDLRYLKTVHASEQSATTAFDFQGVSKFTKELQIGTEKVYDSNATTGHTFTKWTQDLVKNMFVSTAHEAHGGVTVTYDTTDKDIHIVANTPKVVLTGAVTGEVATFNLDDELISLTTTFNSEEIEDIVGAMVDVNNNVQAGIAVTYTDNDETGTGRYGFLDFEVWDHIIKLTGDVTGEVTMDNSSSGATYSIDTTLGTVALGTDTSGAYVQSVAMHSGNNKGVSVAGSPGGQYTIQSNATSENSAETLVYRDVSGNFSCGVMTGTATKARYADLAENYVADKQYEVGTVLSLGGEFEVTESDRIMDSRIVGVVSENPAYLMNSYCTGEFIATVALRGRVPVKVEGPVDKGDIIISSGRGTGVSNNNPSFGSIIGKAVVSKTSEGTELIEVVIT